MFSHKRLWKHEVCNSVPLSCTRRSPNWRWDNLSKICGRTSCLMEWMLWHTLVCKGSTPVIRMAYTRYPSFPSKHQQRVTENFTGSHISCRTHVRLLLTADISVPRLIFEVSWLIMSYSAHGQSYACFVKVL